MTGHKARLLAIVILAFALRAFKIGENFVFSGEFGTEYLYIKEAIVTGILPLIGLPTSHPWLSYGPLYYWFMIPLIKVFGWEPLLGAWVGIIVGTLAVLLNYLVIRKIFNQKIAVISSFIIAISPIWISFSRMARLYVFCWLIWYPFLFYLWQVWRGNLKNIFWLGLTWGLFFNFHFSPILLLPPLLVALFLKRKILKLKHYLLIFAGIIIGNLPTLISDSRGGFSMIKSFAVWIPYRVAGFLGLYPKNNPTLEGFIGSLTVINEFFGKMFVLYEPLWIVSTIGFFVLAGIFLKNNYKRVFKDFGIFFIFFSLVSVLAGVIVHGDPPIHYFLPLFAIPPIFIAILIDKYKIRFWKVALLIFFVFNLKIFFIDPVFYAQVREASLAPFFVPYKLQKEVASYIAADTKGEKFSLKRVGPYDYFSQNYSQNYQYLLWMLGNEPEEKSKLTYTIYEDTQNLPASAKGIKWLRNVAIIKEETK